MSVEPFCVSTLQVAVVLSPACEHSPIGRVGVAEVQGGHSLLGQQPRVGAVLQQQFCAVGVAIGAGCVQGTPVSWNQIGLGPALEQVLQAVGVAMTGRDAQGAAQLSFVLQRPESCGVRKEQDCQCHCVRTHKAFIVSRYKCNNKLIPVPTLHYTISVLP